MHIHSIAVGSNVLAAGDHLGTYDEVIQQSGGGGIHASRAEYPAKIRLQADAQGGLVFRVPETSGGMTICALPSSAEVTLVGSPTLERREDGGEVRFLYDAKKLPPGTHTYRALISCPQRAGSAPAQIEKEIEITVPPSAEMQGPRLTGADVFSKDPGLMGRQLDAAMSGEPDAIKRVPPAIVGIDVETEGVPPLYAYIAEATAVGIYATVYAEPETTDHVDVTTINVDLERSQAETPDRMASITKIVTSFWRIFCVVEDRPEIYVLPSNELLREILRMSPPDQISYVVDADATVTLLDEFVLARHDTEGGLLFRKTADNKPEQWYRLPDNWHEVA